MFEFQEEFASAARYYEKCIPLAHEITGVVQVRVAQMKYKLGLFKQVKEAIECAVKFDPHSSYVSRAIYKIAEDLYKVNHEKDMASEILKLLLVGAEPERSGIVWNRVGHIHYWYSEYELAAEAYDNAINADPDTAIYYSNLARSYSELEDWEQAMYVIEQAINRHSVHICYKGDLYNKWGNDLYAMNDYHAAIKKYQEMEEDGGLNPKRKSKD